MPFSHTISQRDQSAFVRATDPIDLRSSILAIHALASDPVFQPRFKIVVDVREVEYTPSTMDLFSIRDTLANLRERFQGGVTIVVSKSQLYIARLACTIINSAHFQMDAVTELRDPDGREFMNSPG